MTQTFVPAAGKTAGLRWLVLLLLAGALLLGLAMFVDLPLAIYLQRNITSTTDHVFAKIGQIGEGGKYAWVFIVVYVGALVAAHRGWRPVFKAGYDRLVRAALLLMAALIAGGLITLVLKLAIARARPVRYFEHGFYGLGHAFAGKPFDSFPSSHSLTAFVLAATIAVVAPAWRWPAFVVAGVVGLSRLINMDHYASDVLAAAFISIATVHLLAPRFLDARYTWPQRLPWQWFRK
jgi:membrane-associated phospholipid phosphatase